MNLDTQIDVDHGSFIFIHVCLLLETGIDSVCSFVSFDSRSILNMHHLKMYIRVHKLYLEQKNMSTGMNQEVAPALAPALTGLSPNIVVPTRT